MDASLSSPSVFWEAEESVRRHERYCVVTTARNIMAHLRWWLFLSYAIAIRVFPSCMSVLGTNSQSPRVVVRFIDLSSTSAKRPLQLHRHKSFHFRRCRVFNAITVTSSVLSQVLWRLNILFCLIALSLGQFVDKSLCFCNKKKLLTVNFFLVVCTPSYEGLRRKSRKLTQVSTMY